MLSIIDNNSWGTLPEYEKCIRYVVEQIDLQANEWERAKAQHPNASEFSEARQAASEILRMIKDNQDDGVPIDYNHMKELNEEAQYVFHRVSLRWASTWSTCIICVASRDEFAHLCVNGKSLAEAPEWKEEAAPF
jgi:hypothetical protein